MAILFVNNLSQNNSRVVQSAIKALELILLSAGLISTFVMVKGAVIPYSCEFVFSSLMGFWNSIKCFFSSPLYICIVINSMVVLIAVSSAFHRRDNPDDETEVNTNDHDLLNIKSPPTPRDVTEVVESPPIRDITEVVLVAVAPRISPDVEKANLSSQEKLFFNEELMPDLSEFEKMKMGNKISTSPVMNRGKELSMEIENEATTVYDDSDIDKEDDTMEATWNAINGGGKQRPKKKYLKKSETWDVPRRPAKLVATVQRLDSEEVMPSTPKWKELKKSETFDGAVSITCRGGLRRDPSLSLDDFNKQVEAFIKKFNQNIRLQRQESDQRFLDMINQGH